jgi:hypothetical protein
MIRISIAALLSFSFAAHAIPAVTCTLNVTPADASQTAALDPSNPHLQTWTHAYSDITVLVSEYPARASLAGYELNADMTTQKNHFVLRLNLANNKLEMGTQVYLANADEPITVTKDHPVVTLQVGEEVATVRCRQHSF